MEDEVNMIKQLLTIITLGATLAGAVNVSGLTRLEPVDRDALGNDAPITISTLEATADETSLPSCPDGEIYNPPMDRCWPDETPIEDTPEPDDIEPTWGADIQATMDADPYDNDYQYIEWCFEYMDGGTWIRYFPCDATPDPAPGE
jgi:hypothetical protein